MKIVTKGGGVTLNPSEYPRCVHEYLDGGISVRCIRPAGKHFKHRGWTALGNRFVCWHTSKGIKID